MHISSLLCLSDVPSLDTLLSHIILHFTLAWLHVRDLLLEFQQFLAIGTCLGATTELQMALEALGATSGAASLASLGLTACNGLLKYYKSWKDAEKDVKLMYSSVETLGKTFVALRNTLGRPALDAHLVHEVEECILLCEHGIGCLQKKLKKITMNTQSKDVGWNAKIQRKLQRACYPFKESTLVKLKEVSNEMMDHLRLALEILQL